LDFWNGAKQSDNPYIIVEGVPSPAAEAWAEEWDSLHGSSLVMADFQILRTQQEAAKRLLQYPPWTKKRLIKQLLAILDK